MTEKKEEIVCARCAEKFVCNPTDISACNCSKIELSAEEYRFISSTYKTCVCNTCLNALKQEFHKKTHYTKPGNFKDRTLTLLVCCVFFVQVFNAQTYAPPAGQAGTSAMHKDSMAFVNWATGCTVSRGYQDISTTSLGLVTAGDATMATAKAESNGIISLGDGGYAICTFEKPIRNGVGYDFAVFENGFDGVFLELAFVEVSSDGITFFRFPAHSLSDTVNQTSSFGATDATKINNLAGKYRGGYGTPFDLEELTGKSGLNVNAITHVKIIDVVGSVTTAYASRDFYGNKINDPWPTPFPSSGFDLDAVGVIHQSTVTELHENESVKQITIYPNPVKKGDVITLVHSLPECETELLDAFGTVLLKTKEQVVNTTGLKAGIYYLKMCSDKYTLVKKVLVLD